MSAINAASQHLNDSKDLPRFMSVNANYDTDSFNTSNIKNRFYLMPRKSLLESHPFVTNIRFAAQFFSNYSIKDRMREMLLFLEKEQTELNINKYNNNQSKPQLQQMQQPQFESKFNDLDINSLSHIQNQTERHKILNQKNKIIEKYQIIKNNVIFVLFYLFCVFDVCLCVCVVFIFFVF